MIEIVTLKVYGKGWVYQIDSNHSDAVKYLSSERKPFDLEAVVEGKTMMLHVRPYYRRTTGNRLTVFCVQA